MSLIAENLHESYLDVRWSDLDLLGHVNNVAYLTYFENARVEWISDIGGLSHEDGLALVVVQANISYRASATHPASLKVVTTMKRIGNTSMTLHQSLQTKDGSTVYCEADVTAVWLDMADNKPVPVPEFVKQWAGPFSDPA